MINHGPFAIWVEAQTFCKSVGWIPHKRFIDFRGIRCDESDDNDSMPFLFFICFFKGFKPISEHFLPYLSSFPGYLTSDYQFLHKWLTTNPA